MLEAKLRRVRAAKRVGVAMIRTPAAQNILLGCVAILASVLSQIWFAGFCFRLAYRLHVEKAVLGNVEIVAIRIGAAGFRIRPVKRRELSRVFGSNGEMANFGHTDLLPPINLILLYAAGLELSSNAWRTADLCFICCHSPTFPLAGP
jgi:hypothetical protein